MNYWPEGSKILVRPDQVEEKTAGGIILPKQSQESEQTRVQEGEVVAIGPDAVCRFAPDGEERAIQVGDYVKFAKYGGLSIPDGEEEDAYRVVNDEDVFALVTK